MRRDGAMQRMLAEAKRNAEGNAHGLALLLVVAKPACGASAVTWPLRLRACYSRLWAGRCVCSRNGDTTSARARGHAQHQESASRS